MGPLADPVGSSLLGALGWTVIHSLWQGAVLSLGFALLTVLLRRSSPQLRYALGLLTLAAMVLVSGVTFFLVYPAAEPSGTSLAGTLSARADLPSGLVAFVDRTSGWIAGVWLLGIVVLAVRLLGGMAWVRHLRRRSGIPAAPSWQDLLGSLRRRLGIDRLVRLVESGRVSSPLTVGHFRPVIFVPLGLLCGMPADQVEALLVHELAHVARRDYLVNVLQSVVDILYFHHPALCWVSRQIRQERELCCDDLAVSIDGDSLKMARALVRVQVGAGRGPALAMEAAGNKQKLFHRIRRLVTMKQTTSSPLERVVGITLIGLFLLLVGIGAQAAVSKKKAPPPPPPLPVILPEVPAASVAVAEPPAVLPVTEVAPTAGVSLIPPAEAEIPPVPPVPVPDAGGPAVIPSSADDEETARLKAENEALRKQIQELQSLTRHQARQSEERAHRQELEKAMKEAGRLKETELKALQEKAERELRAAEEARAEAEKKAEAAREKAEQELEQAEEAAQLEDEKEEQRENEDEGGILLHTLIAD
ncbi:MAG TPA: M56 family metallopeptidase [Candidatus Aminicenantes bacterium]|nr:M56 family metallopeptidase [Candidatus Aminicenantes bacterium]